MTTQTRTPAERWTLWLLPALLVLLLGLLFSTALRADDEDEEDEGELEFDVAEIYVELNNTDGDLGLHASIDGEPWRRLVIEDSEGRDLLNVKVRSGLRRQGLTEFFFESAEPTFDELTPEQFFQRFPEGVYEVEARTIDKQEMEAEVMFSHVVPAAPDGITVQGMAVPPDCDAEEFPEVDASAPVVVAWAAVTSHHPTIGRAGPVEVGNYQVVAEVDDTPFVFSTHLPASATSITLPADFLSLSDEFKLEVLVRDVNNNQVATETCFAVAAP